MSKLEVPAFSIVAMRPFLPAKDFARSRGFYEALGFETHELGEGLLDVRRDAFCFLLQDFFVRDWAENFVMHLLVDDVAAWFAHVEALDLPGRFGVPAPQPPKREPWGLTVTYVFDPSGVLWHLAEPS